MTTLTDSLDDSDIHQTLTLLEKKIDFVEDEEENEVIDSNSDDSDSSPDEVWCLDEESQRELELMRQMGLPINFGSKTECKQKVNLFTQHKMEISQNSDKRKITENSENEQEIIDDEEVYNKNSISGKIYDNKKQRAKYWNQRYRLFSRFDEGIKLDDESWYSVTPEQIAKHIAERCQRNHPCIIIDAFCGAGGNTIQFALLPNVYVIAIDIDPIKIDLCKNNAHVYGVADKIEFIIGNYMQLIDSLKADVVFLSPPWGGPKYLQKKKYKLKMMKPNGNQILQVTKDKITSNIAILLPRNINVREFDKFSISGNFVEIEKNFLVYDNSERKKVKTVTAYFGDLVKFEENDEKITD